MADNSLAAALQGIYTQPAETPFGIGALTLSQMTPSLINPYGNVGANIGIALGSGLISALLGYQAKKQAMEQNLALQPLITQALQAKTPEAIDVLISQPGGAPLADVGTQLKLGLLASEAEREKRKQALGDELQLMMAKEYGVVPRGMEDLISVPTAGDLTLKQQRELGFEEEKLRRKQAIEAPQKLAEENLAKSKLVQQLRQDVNTDPLTKMYGTAKSNLQAAKEVATSDTAAASLQFKKIVERAVNPDNQVTLQELQGYNEIMPIMEKYQRWALSKTEGLADLSPAARQELISAVEKYVDALGETYTNKVQNAFDFAKRQNWTQNIEDVAPVSLPTKTPGLSYDAQISQLEQIVSDANVSEATKQLARQKIDELLGQ